MKQKCPDSLKSMSILLGGMLAAGMVMRDGSLVMALILGVAVGGSFIRRPYRYRSKWNQVLLLLPIPIVFIYGFPDATFLEQCLVVIWSLAYFGIVCWIYQEVRKIVDF